MCGRFTLIDPEQALTVQFNMPAIPGLKPRYNIAPSQPVLAVRPAPKGGDREAVLLTWGLVPFWAKDPAIGARLINARAETVAEKPAFRAAFRRRRCLVLADGFYEWQRPVGGQEGRQPYYVRLREGRPFAFAGLWEHWEGADGSVIESCTLLTTAANDLLRAVHNRMPVILSPPNYDLWLDTTAQAGDRLKSLLHPYPPEEMEAYAVSRWVNNPRNDDPRCIEPLAQQPGLRAWPDRKES